MIKKYKKPILIILAIVFMIAIIYHEEVIGMANKYANLVAGNKIKNEYEKINQGFDKVESDVNSIITGQELDPNKDLELLSSRGGFKTLGDRLNNTENEKADKIYVDSQILNIDNKIENIGDASPKGTYSTLVALQSAFPNGTNGIYVVTADGNWYYWNGTAWTAGGTYQSTGIADNSIDPIQTSFFVRSKNLFNKDTVINGYYVNQTNGVLQANPKHKVSDWIPVKPSTEYDFTKICFL